MDVVGVAPGEDLGQFLVGVERLGGGADWESLVVAEEDLGAASGAAGEHGRAGDHRPAR
ncbi:hypothetical protein [Streptosporangium sp. NPDC087985]|uniref:hypothetical protein n=1 Tax=Streptosporangium sp. NPDC087985 TaxID=3366196 RepID=UPI0038048FE3